MSFTLVTISGAEAQSMIDKILPSDWQQKLFHDLDITAKALNIELNFQSYIVRSEIALLSMALLYTILQNCEKQETKNTIKAFVCSNLDKSPEYLLIELSQKDNRVNLITLLVEFKKSLSSIEHFTGSTSTLMYEPIAAINFIQQKIKLKLQDLGFADFNQEGYSVEVVQTWLDFLKKLFNQDMPSHEAWLIKADGKIVDICWSQISVLVLHFLKDSEFVRCSEKVFTGLEQAFLAHDIDVFLELADFDHNPFSIFAYYDLLKPTKSLNAMQLIVNYFSSINELIRSQFYFIFIAHQKYRKRPLDINVIRHIREHFNMKLDFIDFLMFNPSSNIETQSLVLEMISVMSTSEKRTFFEKLNSNQQNYLQYINYNFPSLFKWTVYEFSFLVYEDRKYILLQLDESQENLLISTLRNENFQLLISYLIQEFDLDFICDLLMQAELNHQNVLSLVSDESFEFLVNFISKLPENIQKALLTQRINQENILNWILINRHSRLNTLLVLFLECEPYLFEGFLREGETSIGAPLIALTQSSICIVELLGFVKQYFPHLMFQIIYQNCKFLSIDSGAPLLISALLQKSPATDYIIAEINELSPEERQLIYTFKFSNKAPPLFFALLSEFKYRSILASCLQLRAREMKECLLAFPFNLDEFINEASSWMIGSLSEKYFESLLDLDGEDFILTLLANKLIFNHSQSNVEILNTFLTHGMKLCSSSTISQAIVINFNKFLNQLLSKQEFRIHLPGLIQLVLSYLNKPTGHLFSGNLASVFLNLSYLLIQNSQQTLFNDVSVALSLKNPQMIKNILQVIPVEVFFKAHQSSGFLFLPLSFGCSNYQILLEKLKGLNTDERLQLLIQKQDDIHEFLLYVCNNFQELFPVALSLLSGLQIEQQLALWLNEDETGKFFILKLAQNTKYILDTLVPYINHEQLRTIFTMQNKKCLGLLEVSHQLDFGSLECLLKFLSHYPKTLVMDILQAYPKELQEELKKIPIIYLSGQSFFSQDVDSSSTPSESKKFKLQGNQDVNES